MFGSLLWVALLPKSATETKERSTSRDDDDSMQNICLMLSTTSTAFFMGASLQPVIASRKACRCVRILKRYDPRPLSLLQLLYFGPIYFASSLSLSDVQ